MDSKGVLVKRRSCRHRKGQKAYKTADCKGLYYDVVLCDDSLLCIKERKTIDSFIAMKCKLFNNAARKPNLTFQLKAKPTFQASHDVEKPWIACTIFCEEKDMFNTSTISALRLEMINFDIDPSFPDGTWCHNKDGQNYYCRQHYCLPEKYS